MRHTIGQHIGGSACAFSVVISGLLLGGTLVIYWQAIVYALGLTAEVSPSVGANFRPVDSPEAVTAHYIYPRPPPPHFREWLQFAQRKRCELRQFDHIEQDLEPFRRLVAEQGVEALQAAVEKAGTLGNTATFTVRGGNLSEEHAATRVEYAVSRYHDMFASIAEWLPDMRFAVNLLDEPRVLVGPGSVNDRYASATCANASADFHEFRHLHSFVISPATPATDANETLPVFSQTKIRGCHSDIMLPTHYSFQVQPVRRRDAPPWSSRKPVLFFRGSTTGGMCNDNTPHWNMHRQRLAEYGKNHSDMDLGLSSFIQCTLACCKAMMQQYGEAEHVDHKEVWRHRFLMILDGNSFSSRLPVFLSSGSLLFRAGLFAEWFDERIWPMKHYLPVRLDFSDLRERLDWAKAHDAEAHVMADAAKRVAHRRLRYQDIQCYMYRLLIEYAALFGNASLPSPPPPEKFGAEENE